MALILNSQLTNHTHVFFVAAKCLLKYLHIVHNSVWATCYKNQTILMLKLKNNVKENDSKHYQPVELGDGL